MDQPTDVHHSVRSRNSARLSSERLTSSEWLTGWYPVLSCVSPDTGRH